MSDISSKVVEIIVDKLGVDASEAVPTASFTNDLGADSLDVVELLMGLEESTGKTIPEDKVAEIKTVGDIIKVLETL